MGGSVALSTCRKMALRCRSSALLRCSLLWGAASSLVFQDLPMNGLHGPEGGGQRVTANSLRELMRNPAHSPWPLARDRWTGTLTDAQQSGARLSRVPARCIARRTRVIAGSV
jgi:hypothetical protein